MNASVVDEHIEPIVFLGDGFDKRCEGITTSHIEWFHLHFKFFNCGSRQ